LGVSSARATRFADDGEPPTADEDAAAAAAHKKRAEELQEQRRALESSPRGLQTAGITDGPATEALQTALTRVAALQQAHRSEKESALPTRILHDRACRDRDQAVQKLSRTQGELEETQTQLATLLKRQEELHARAKDQSANVEQAAKKAQELGQRLAVETAAASGSSPFTADGIGFAAPAGSPFKRQRPEA
jgi:myosin heavy subunit